MKRLTAALGTVLVMGMPALAAPSDPGAPAHLERIAEAPPRPGPGSGPPPRPGMWPMPPRFQHPPVDGQEIAMRLAARLSAAETLIGIRAEQLDAWRGYTSALIDLFEPPAPPPPPGPGGDGDKAFAREEQMARRIKERAARADTLLQAITALRSTLTDDQLAKLGRIDLSPRPPMPPGPGHPAWPGPADERPADGMAPPAPDIPDDTHQPATAPRPG